MMRSVGAHVHLTGRDWTPFSVAFRQEMGESLIFVKCRVRFPTACCTTVRTVVQVLNHRVRHGSQIWGS